MKKYDEIMEHIKVTNSMHERILSNIDQEFSKKRVFKYKKWIPAIGSAAAALLIIITLSLWGHHQILQPSDSTTDSNWVQNEYNPQEYTSSSELSKAAGFEIPDLKSIPFNITQTTYTAIDSNLFQIYYAGNTDFQTLTFRKSIGTQDNSGDYTEYTQVKEITVNSYLVSLKGDATAFYLATWTDGQYAYSINLSCGCSFETMQQLINEAMA